MYVVKNMNTAEDIPKHGEENVNALLTSADLQKEISKTAAFLKQPLFAADYC